MSDKQGVDAVYEFGKRWETAGKFRWFYHPVAIFKCDVVYEYKGHTRTLHTTASLWHDGKLHLADAEWFNSLDHYSEFHPDWQQYTLTDTDNLRVNGTGQKLGRYAIEMRPT